MAILSRRQIPLDILLYEQFIPHTQITLRPNMQLLSTQQHAYQSFLSYFLVSVSVYNMTTRWVNFRERHLHKHELQLSDYNMGKYSCPNVQITGRKIYFSSFLLIKFSRSKAKNVNNTRNTYIWVKILPHIVVG